jgi:hypothetical protein
MNKYQKNFRINIFLLKTNAFHTITTVYYDQTRRKKNQAYNFVFISNMLYILNGCKTPPLETNYNSANEKQYKHELLTSYNIQYTINSLKLVVHI